MSQRRDIRYRTRSCRLGFTLIEVLLSLGLATLVLVALATAVDLHLRCLNISQTNVEEAQLARTLLLRMGDDLRNAVVINPVDSSKIAPAPSESSSGTAGSTGDTDPASEESTDESTTGTTSETTTTTDTEDEYVLGLYGESDWLQVDVRRTPRLDQYNYETLPGSEILPDRVSGIKTIAYSLHEETGLESGMGEYEGGLMRREIDHAVTRWAEDTGALTSADQQLKAIAPEVTDLEFLYYDGSAWVDSWDSTELGGLPLAVHISIAVMPREQLRRFSKTLRDSTYDEKPITQYVYSLTVALPVAQGDTSSTETSAETGEVSESE